MYKDVNIPDVDEFRHEGGEHEYIEDLEQLPEEDRQQMILAGINVREEQRSGTYIQEDHSVVHCKAKQEGLEVMDVKTALKIHDWLEDYMWKGVNPKADEYTRKASFAKRSPYWYF